MELPDFESRIVSCETIEKEAHNFLSLIKTESLSLAHDQLVANLVHTKLETLAAYLPSDFFYPYLKSKDFIHGDFHNEKVLFDKLTGIVRLLDLEESHLGHRIVDLLHFVPLTCCNTGFQKSNLQKARFFVQAYHHLLPLTCEEALFGVRYVLFKECSSFFIERALYQSKNLFFIHLVRRDLAKILYLRQNTKAFIVQLGL